MIRLKNLLLEQVDFIIQNSPNSIVNKASKLFFRVFRIKEISRAKVGSNKQWDTLSNDMLLKQLSASKNYGAGTMFADGSYYYVMGVDLKSKAKKEVYDVLLFPKKRVINIVKGEKQYSNIDDYLASQLKSIGKIGTSDLITFKDFYKAINPAANIGEKTDTGEEITGAYLQLTIGDILDPDGTAIDTAKSEIEAEKDSKIAAEKAAIAAEIQKAKEDFELNKASYIDKWFWKIVEQGYDVGGDIITITKYSLYRIVNITNDGTILYLTYDLRPKTAKSTIGLSSSSSAGQYKTISEMFSAENLNSKQYITLEQFSKLEAISAEEQFDTMKSFVGGGGGGGTTQDKILIDYTFKTHGKQQLTGAKIKELFSITDATAETTSLKSAMAAGSLQTMIIQLLLKREVAVALKADTTWYPLIQKTCLVSGKNALDTYDTIASPADGNYGTKSQNMMRVYTYVYISQDHGSTAWQKLLSDAAAAWPTYKFLKDTIFHESFKTITESKTVSLKNLLLEKNNLTYDFLFEIAPPPAITPSTTPPAPEKKTPVKTEPKTTTKTTVKTEPETKKDSETAVDTTDTKSLIPGLIPGTSNILISGLHSETTPGYKSLAQQNILADTNHVFGWESAANLDTKDLLYQVLKNNTTGQIICFSKGCEYASEIAALMTNKDNLWIVEPYGKITIPDGVWKSHVILGPDTNRGSANFEEGMINTPKGTDHWGALKLAGEKAKKWTNVINGVESGSEEDQAVTDTTETSAERDISAMFKNQSWKFADAIYSYDGTNDAIRLNGEIIIGNWSRDVPCNLELREDGTIQISNGQWGAVQTKFFDELGDTVFLRGIGPGWSNGGKSLTAKLFPETDYEMQVSVTGTSLSDCIVKAFKSFKVSTNPVSNFKSNLKNLLTPSISLINDYRFFNKFKNTEAISVWPTPTEGGSSGDALKTF